MSKIEELRRLEKLVNDGLLQSAEIKIVLDVDADDGAHALDAVIMALIADTSTSAKVLNEYGNGSRCHAVEFTGTPGEVATLLERYEA